MVFRSLGLRQPKVDASVANRLPPGQYLTERWPVLHYGDVPGLNSATWELQVVGAVENPVHLTWTEFNQLPKTIVTADMHCVTRWSKLDQVWESVSFQTILDLVKPLQTAHHLLFLSEHGSTANIPLAVASDAEILLATHANGEVLEPDHGYPLRSVVPMRYALKSAKWLRGIDFMTEDRPEFWENYGYNNNADFWKEERIA